MVRFCLAWGLLLGMSATGAWAASPAQQTAPLKPHPVVALTFDDLPAAGGLPKGDTRVRILTTLSDELRAAHLKGIYGFVNAVDLHGDADAQQALRLWLQAGMNIGNHTWSHPALSDVTAQEYEENIAKNEPYLREYAGNRNWHFFRFPYLEEGDTVAKRENVRNWLHDHGYRIAEVTLNFNDDDWSDPYIRCLTQHNEAGIAWLEKSYMQNAAEFLREGRQEEQIAYGHEIPNVLLLHGTVFTTLMLPRLLALLKQEGFRFEPLAKVERNKAYQKDWPIGLPNGDSLPSEVLDSNHLPWPTFTPEPSQQLDSVCPE